MTRKRLLIPFATLLCILSGCRVAQSVVEPNGPAAKTISDLIWGVFLVFSAVGVIMWILIAWIVLRRRNGTLQYHAPVDAGGGHYWVWIGGLAIPFVILAAVFIAGLQAMSKFPVHDGHMLPPADIQIVGHQWWWEVHYRNGPENQQFTTANEIHIPVGKTVDIDLTSRDVIHSFWVPRLNGKFDLIPGQNNRIRLEANTPGEYRGQCAEYCGAQHAHMNILVIAQSQKDYNSWRMHQFEPAVLPLTQQQKNGQAQFLSKPCALCHEIEGTDAHGRVAPNLTHVASRRGLAANSLRNDTANLSAWVTHAQALKPGSEMPNVTQFSGQELQDLVAYLQSLQ
jgi:cytochrome c oxidase subunit 2